MDLPRRLDATNAMNYKKELDSASVDLVVWEIASAIVTFLVASGCARMRLASLFLLLEHRQLHAH